MKLYLRWKWFDLSWLKIFRTSSDWFPWRAKCWLLNLVLLFYFCTKRFLRIVELCLGLNASILNWQAHVLVCKKLLLEIVELGQWLNASIYALSSQPFVVISWLHRISDQDPSDWTKSNFHYTFFFIRNLG